MKKLIVIVGPTAVGKTDLSIKIAKQLNTVIISADSRQIYKELKIGTAVPSDEQLNAVKHYFIGNKSIHDYYNVSLFEMEVLELLNELFKEKDTVLMVGGSTLYIDTVCYGIDDFPRVDPEIRKSLMNRLETEGIESLRFDLKRLDPEHYKTVDLKNHKRILKALEICIMTGKPYSEQLTHSRKVRDFEIQKIGLNREREELFANINSRVVKMIDEGLIEEAKSFYQFKNLNSLNTVGYKELFAHFDGQCTQEQAIEQIKVNTRRYAKRQITWFKKDETMQWFHPEKFVFPADLADKRG